jgi:hypothetical protein
LEWENNQKYFLKKALSKKSADENVSGKPNGKSQMKPKIFDFSVDFSPKGGQSSLSLPLRGFILNEEKGWTGYGSKETLVCR